MTAVIYARYSSDSQREASIEGQLRDCKDYAEKNGITVVGTYIDRAYSAKTDDRPDFQRMIKDSGKKIFDVVLVQLPDQNHIEDFLRAVLNHPLEVRTVIRLGRIGTVDVGADHGDTVLLGVVLAVAQLSFNGRFALAVRRIAGVDHSSHGCTSLACIRLALIVSDQAQLVNNLQAD